MDFMGVLMEEKEKMKIYSKIRKYIESHFKGKRNSRILFVFPGIIFIFSLLILSFPVCADKGNWRVLEGVNPVDNTKTTIMFLAAESGKSKRGDVPDLIIRCKSNEINLYINWNEFLSTDDIKILTRMGDEKAEIKKWKPSFCKEKSFYPDSSVKFIRRMFKKNKFLAQVTPYGESPITAVFNTSGMKNIIKPLQENCGWK